MVNDVLYRLKFQRGVHKTAIHVEDFRNHLLSPPTPFANVADLKTQKPRKDEEQHGDAASVVLRLAAGGISTLKHFPT